MPLSTAKKKTTRRRSNQEALEGVLTKVRKRLNDRPQKQRDFRELVDQNPGIESALHNLGTQLGEIFGLEAEKILITGLNRFDVRPRKAVTITITFQESSPC